MVEDGRTGEHGWEDDGSWNLLFLCTGNTCRSPLAEALARREAGRRGMDDRVVCRSAGTIALEGGTASVGSTRIAFDLGMDLSKHRSRPLTRELAEWADLVLCMSEAHRDRAIQMGGGIGAVLVTAFLPDDHPEHRRPVHDPVGGSLEEYRETARLLEEAVRGLFDRILDREREEG